MLGQFRDNYLIPFVANCLAWAYPCGKYPLVDEILTSERPEVTLIADAENASAEIVASALRVAGARVNTVPTSRLQGVALAPNICVSRVCAPEFSWLPEYLQRRGGYTYVLDDFLFAVDPMQDPRGAKIFGHRAAQDCLLKFLRGARRVVARSKSLAKALRDYVPGLEVSELAPPVDWALFDQLREKHAAPPKRNEDVVRIGYPTTPRLHFSELITNIVHGAQDRFGSRVQFEFMGWWPHAVSMRPHVTCLPGVRGYARYAEIAASRHWDIGIAPVGDSFFENCKTPLKFLEYSALRIPGIYSRVPLFTSVVRDDLTGLLVSNSAEAWLDAIGRLVNDSELRQAISLRAATQLRCDADMKRIGNALLILMGIEVS